MSNMMKELTSDAKNGALILAGLAASKFVKTRLLQDFDKENSFKPLLIPVLGYFASRQVPIKWARTGLKEGFVVSLIGGGMDVLKLREEKDYFGLAGDTDEVKTFQFNGMQEVKDFADSLVNGEIEKQIPKQFPKQEEYIIHGEIIEEPDEVIQAIPVGNVTVGGEADFSDLMGEYRYDGEPILSGDFE